MGNLAAESELVEFKVEQSNSSVDFVLDFRPPISRRTILMERWTAVHVQGPGGYDRTAGGKPRDVPFAPHQCGC